MTWIDDLCFMMELSSTGIWWILNGVFVGFVMVYWFQKCITGFGWCFGRVLYTVQEKILVDILNGVLVSLLFACV